MTRTSSLIAIAVLAAAGANIAGAQQPKPATQQPKPAARAYKRDIPKALAAEAKVTEETASATAMSKVPNGRIRAVELEREKGKLMYSYDIKVPGKSGVEEVNVDAVDGSVLAVEHESAKTEAREKKAEAKAKTPAKKKS